MAFQLDVKYEGGVPIVTLSGKLLLGDGDVYLRKEIDSIILLHTGVKALILDLSNVPYMDSGGAGEIVRTQSELRRNGFTLVLCGLQQRVTDLFTVTHIIVHFTITQTLAQALAKTR